MEASQSVRWMVGEYLPTSSVGRVAWMNEKGSTEALGRQHVGRSSDQQRKEAGTPLLWTARMVTAYCKGDAGEKFGFLSVPSILIYGS